MEKKRTIQPRRNLVLWIALAAAFLPALFLIWRSMHLTGGAIIYPVDDTFIHMELAKNLALHGNWGINAGEFASASSSLLYTLILALLFKLFSVHTIFPLFINIFFGAWLVVFMHRWLCRQGLKSGHQLFIELMVIVLTPLPILMISGMEHTLQCFLSFVVLVKTTDYLERCQTQNEDLPLPWSIPLLGMLLTSIRYEGLFLAAVLCLLLLWYKKFSSFLFLSIASVLPVIIFGLYSMSRGSYFLPNSVLIKSDEVALFGQGIGHLIETLVEKLTLAKTGITAVATQRLLILLPLTGWIFITVLRSHLSWMLSVIVLTLVTLLHLCFASTGKFYRYEAYLIFSSVLIVSLVMLVGGKVFFQKASAPRTIFAGIFLFFIALPLLLRSSAAFTKAERACINIYEQQYQMGKFLSLNYPTATVAANDIGAVSFYTSGQVVDLWGLGSTDIARSRKKGNWNALFLDSFSRRKNVSLAIIYDSWFNHGFDSLWRKVATWKIPENVVCGDDTVSFYVLDPTTALDLKQKLQQFQSFLPAEVSVKYY